MARVRPVGSVFFPLDEQLELSSGGLTPRAEQTVVRLSSWMSFEAAQELLADLLGIAVSKATARRTTLAIGEAQLALDEREQERLKQERPEPPAGAAKQVMSGDGAMVHLVAGEWVEVKTLALGEVTRNARGEITTEQLSYFSRLADATAFEEAALIETHRRGLEQAVEVCAVQDGAGWLQGLTDYHRADAVRILDFAHAAEYIHEIGESVRAVGGRLPPGWLKGVLHRLKHQGPDRVLTHLRWLAAHYPSPSVEEKLAYVQKREAQMQYPTYQQSGWPIGSGSVESANKLVVEARLKGAGMRWERQNVNSMLVLRNAVCNHRWDETWQTARKERQAQRSSQRQAESQARLIRAFWTLVGCGVRLAQLTSPPTEPAPTATAVPLVRRLDLGYSWRKPFLRRPPSTPGTPAELRAKK